VIKDMMAITISSSTSEKPKGPFDPDVTSERDFFTPERRAEIRFVRDADPMVVKLLLVIERLSKFPARPYV
jgi:hypothetical protein